MPRLQTASRRSGEQVSFSVGKIAFVAALGHLGNVVPSRGIELNRCAVMEVSAGKLTLTALADLGVSITLPAETGLMGELPPTAVPVALLHDLARNMGGREIEMELGHKGLTLRSGSNVVDVTTVPATPEDLEGMRPNFTHGPTPIALNVADLKAALDATKYASSNEAFQAVMRGILIEFSPERVRFVASDGYRLATADLEVSSASTFTALPITRLLVPALKVLEGQEHCAVSVRDGWLIARTASASVSIPLLDGEYPDYTRIIPAVTGKTVKVNAATLAASINRVSVMSDKNDNNRIDFEAVPREGGYGTLRLTAEGDYGRGVDVMDMKPGSELEHMTTGFNAKYLLEALAACKGDVTLDFSGGPRSPVRLTSEAQGVLAVMVPLRA